MAHIRRTSLVCSAILALATAVFPIHPAAATTERIGNAIQIIQTVTGEIQANFRYLILEDPVFQDEVIATKPGSASRIVFRDNTELQVGPQARVTLDDFVFDPDPSVARFVISAFDGVLRFATGKLAKDAYQIETPTAIIGVRGTTFVSIFGPQGQQVILLEDGTAVTVQDRNGGPLHTLAQPGLSVTVRPDGSVSNPEPAPQWALEKIRELNALLLTLDEMERGDHINENDREPQPVIEEAAIPQPVPPPPALAAKPKEKPKKAHKPHKRHEKARPRSKPKHSKEKYDKPKSHTKQRSDIRIERRSRKTRSSEPHARVERDENHQKSANRHRQLEARAPDRKKEQRTQQSHKHSEHATYKQSDDRKTRNHDAKDQQTHSRTNKGKQHKNRDTRNHDRKDRQAHTRSNQNEQQKSRGTRNHDRKDREARNRSDRREQRSNRGEHKSQSRNHGDQKSNNRDRSNRSTSNHKKDSHASKNHGRSTKNRNHGTKRDHNRHDRDRKRQNR